MKKSLFFSVMVGGLIASFFIGTSLSQETDRPVLKLDKLIRTEFDDDGDRQKLQSLFEGQQKQLLELSKTMTDRELETLIDQMRRLTYDREANEKLQRAIKELQSLVKDFDTSPAGHSAKIMLKALRTTDTTRR